MGTGELVQLPRARDFVKHFRKLWFAADGIGKSLSFHDKFRVFNLVECAQPIGQLHASLKSAVALARNRQLPLGSSNVQALHSKRFAASAARGWHGGECGLTRHFTVNSHRRNHINQCVQARLFFRCCEQRKVAQ